jgi:hypothetical protein
MATSTTTLRPSWSTTGTQALALAAYALGAALLAGEAAVHIQQYATGFDQLAWIGPLFLANAAACILAIAGLAFGRTRQLAALAGVAISALALGALLLSYANGIFGWQEFGIRTPLEIAAITELGAVMALSAGLAASAALPRAR